MVWSKCWEVFHQAKQGVCIFNCKLEKIYANEKAKQVFRAISVELCLEFRENCQNFMAMVREKEDNVLTYSGMLSQRYEVFHFSLFSFYSEEQIFVMVVFHYTSSAENHPEGEVSFTPREKMILQAIAVGKTNKEISEQLSIGFETVKSHVRNLLAKTGTSSRTELISKYCKGDNDTIVWM